MSTHWISDYQRPNDFVELTLDELEAARQKSFNDTDYHVTLDMYRAIQRRLARKHAILDLSEDLSEQGLILVKEGSE